MDRSSISSARFHSVEVRKPFASSFSRPRLLWAGCGLGAFLACGAVQAQQGTPPGYDPKQTEKRFEDQTQTPAGRPRLPTPQFGRAETHGDAKPLFVLRHISITGAAALPPARLAESYKAFVGKKVSQADLAAITAAVGDIYGEAGFHLTRAVIPPQDIQNGRIELRVIEGSITELSLKGDGAERFGARPLLEAVLTERPSRVSTLERQLLRILSRWRTLLRLHRTTAHQRPQATTCP